MTAREFAMRMEGAFEHEMFLQEEAWKRTIAQINIHLPKGKKINPNKFSRKKKAVRLPTREETLALVKKWR